MKFSILIILVLAFISGTQAFRVRNNLNLETGVNGDDRTVAQRQEDCAKIPFNYYNEHFDKCM